MSFDLNSTNVDDCLSAQPTRFMPVGSADPMTACHLR